MSTENMGYKQELRRSLTVWDLTIYGMIFMVPIAPFGVFGSVWDATKGLVPLAYCIGMVAMIFTAKSYWSMSRAFPVAGSVYTYATKGIHETVGFFAGWLILLDYILVPALLYIVSAAALSAVQPNVPTWVCVVIFIAINTAVNFRGIDFTARANRYILAAEIIVLAIFVVIGLYALYTSPDHHGLTMKPWYNAESFSVPMLFGAVSIAVLSFLGFDGISTLSEESKDGVDSVGKASMLALLVVGVLFILQTWIAAELAVGLKFDSLDTAFYDTAHVAGGDALKQITVWATILSWGIANALVAQAAIARIMYSMARDGKLPGVLSKIHPRYKTPYISTFVVAGVSLVTALYFDGQIANLSSLVNFGALCGFVLLHVSVINHYVVRQGSRQWVSHLLVPLAGLTICGYVVYAMDAHAKTLGLAWLGIGVVYYLVQTKLLKRSSALNSL
jgi:amino acid transporter